MFKKLLLTTIATLTLAGPSLAAPIDLGNGKTFISATDMGLDHALFVTAVGSPEHTQMWVSDSEFELGDTILYVNCVEDTISFDGLSWSRIDHRTTETYFHTAACENTRYQMY